MMVIGCMCVTVNAAPAIDEEKEMVGLVAVEPNARTASIPTRGWNVSTQGRYEISGSSDYQTLYTLYYFTGANKYYIYIKNYQGSDQQVRCRLVSNDSAFVTKTIPAKGELGFEIDQENAWYLEFTGGLFSDGSSVSGYVEAR